MKDTKYQVTVPLSEYVPKHVQYDATLEACKHCPIWGRNWACPPFDFDPMDVWNSYDSIVLVCHQYDFEGEDVGDLQKFFYDKRKQLALELYAMEAENPGSRALLIGTCDLCGVDNCARIIGKPCRHPRWMRHSLEAIGGNVMTTIDEYFDIPTEWPEDGVMKNMTICGGLLRK
ncbi:MAG: DUF2284 domain-containing protein [Eubacteriales bacterium]|nr:DUF2284 domain-containing protein [Eubacteriales bacterium]